MKRINKKLLSAILCLMLLVTGLSIPAVADANEEVDNRYELADFRSGDVYSYPEMPGYVFGGWYSDADFTKPIGKTVKDGLAYAKFVDEKVLTVKHQITVNTTTASTETALRMVTTVDNLKYAEVGFIFSVGGASTQRTTDTVYESIIGFVDGEDNVYSPKEFSDSSCYFMTYEITEIANEFFGTDFTVTPIWTTLDGTTVQGEESNFMIYDFIEGKESVYGDGITVTPAKVNSANQALFYVTEGTHAQGQNAGKTYTYLYTDFDGGCWGQSMLTVKATQEAGLKANTDYKVTVNVETNSTSTGWTYASGEFMVYGSADTITFDITTDGNGCFEKNWYDVTISASRIYFTGIKIEATGSSVYGRGITVTPAKVNSADQALFYVTEGTFEEGHQNAGQTYTYLYSDFEGGCWGKSMLTVKATQEAGLKANTNYQVTVYVKTNKDTTDRTYFSSEFIVYGAADTITFDITTDGNGCFEKNWYDAYTGADRIYFTGIEIVEV